MPIRFRCQRCRQLLGIASRKAGTAITCPRCGVSQTVPNKAEAAATEPRSSDTPETIQMAVEAAVAEDAKARQTALKDATEDDIPGLDSRGAADVPPLPGQDEVTAGAPRPDPSTPPPGASSIGRAATTPPLAVPPSATPPVFQSPISQSPTFQSPVTLPGVVSQAPRPPEADRRPDAGLPVPSDMILFPRRVVYIQAVLYIILAVVAFSMGYFIGRGENQAEPGGRQAQTIHVEGKVIYNPGTGQVAGDEGAAIIILPEGNPPAQRLAVDGLRPDESPPREHDRALGAIEDLGGTYARASASGEFSFVLPKRGKYRMLVISRRASRARDLPIDEVDMNQIDQYFDSAERLLKQAKYSWKPMEIDIGLSPILVDFGMDGQK